MRGPRDACYECWSSPNGKCRDYDPDRDGPGKDTDDSSGDEPIKTLSSKQSGWLLIVLMLLMLVLLAEKRPLFQPDSEPEVEVVINKKRPMATPAVARPPLTPAPRPAGRDISFAFLFGQTALSSSWLEERATIKDMMAGLMNSICPRGKRDMQDWADIGRRIGEAIDGIPASAEDAEEDSEDSISAQDQADKAKPSGSGSKDVE
jgi:hypothetical protein